jgi:hypothetical protein
MRFASDCCEEGIKRGPARIRGARPERKKLEAFVIAREYFEGDVSMRGKLLVRDERSEK